MRHDAGTDSIEVLDVENGVQPLGFCFMRQRIRDKPGVNFIISVVCVCEIDSVSENQRRSMPKATEHDYSRIYWPEIKKIPL
jgi:hypothetical protein